MTTILSYEELRALIYPVWGTDVERERHRRIRLTLWAYAYEVEADSIVTDEEYDRVSLQVDVDIDTGRPDLDAFFREHFDPSTGMWIHKHPELDKVAAMYRRYRSYREG